MGFLKILFFIVYKQNFIASDYRQDLFMFNNYQFTKYFIKLGVLVCVFFYVFWEEISQLQFLQFSQMNFCNQKEKERCNKCKFMLFS